MQTQAEWILSYCPKLTRVTRVRCAIRSLGMWGARPNGSNLSEVRRSAVRAGHGMSLNAIRGGTHWLDGVNGRAGIRATNAATTSGGTGPATPCPMAAQSAAQAGPWRAGWPGPPAGHANTARPTHRPNPSRAPVRTPQTASGTPSRRRRPALSSGRRKRLIFHGTFYRPAPAIRSPHVAPGGRPRCAKPIWRNRLRSAGEQTGFGGAGNPCNIAAPVNGPSVTRPMFEQI